MCSDSDDDDDDDEELLRLELEKIKQVDSRGVVVDACYALLLYV
jgi:hypothetical protein